MTIPNNIYDLIEMLKRQEMQKGDIFDEFLRLVYIATEPDDDDEESIDLMAIHILPMEYIMGKHVCNHYHGDEKDCLKCYADKFIERSRRATANYLYGITQVLSPCKYCGAIPKYTLQANPISEHIPIRKKGADTFRIYCNKCIDVEEPSSKLKLFEAIILWEEANESL